MESKQSPQIIYDLAIVGRGMIGSAAARHAAILMQGSSSSAKIALVGPSEDSSSNVYGAHHDEGRITRKTDPDPIWAELASRSIDRYPDISGAQKSSFYVECGHLAVSNQGSPVLQTRLENVERMNLKKVERFKDNPQLKQAFPYLTFPDNCEGLLERANAGYISARGLVQAQCLRAQEMGVEIHDTVVQEIKRTGPNHFEIIIKGNDPNQTPLILAKKVLVATGAFTNYKTLLPVQLDLTPIQTQTVHFLLDAEDVERLKSMPSVIFKDPNHWAYLLPPIRYPDGSLRLKLGGGRVDDPNDRSMQTCQQVLNWYQSDGNPTSTAEMTQLLHRIVPNCKPTKIITDTCATLNTPTRQAYIGELAPGWAVATGGNGFAAKSSDELGRLGALCVVDPEAFGRERICGQNVAELLKPIKILATDNNHHHSCTTENNNKRY